MSISWRNRGIFALVKGPPSINPVPMLADPLLAALDEALECPLQGDPDRADRLALALWWLIERVADEFQIPTERAADEVAMLCGLAKEMMGEAGTDSCEEPLRDGPTRKAVVMTPHKV